MQKYGIMEAELPAREKHGKGVTAMRIIDAHLHLFDPRQYDGCLSSDKLAELFGRLGIEAGIVMGNQPLTPEAYDFPEPFRYCVGIGDFQRTLEPDEDTLDALEEHLSRPRCAGIKIYTGYAPVWPSDGRLRPYYELAQQYGKPVAFHMGMTAGSMGALKYSNPLALDEAAAEFPGVQFVMCHFGNPFLQEAAAVMEKNHNVAADLSGLLDGATDLDRFFRHQEGYVQALRTWMRYVDDDSRFMFGTDYPAADMENYIEFITRLVDEESLEKVLFHNADRIYNLGL